MSDKIFSLKDEDGNIIVESEQVLKATYRSDSGEYSYFFDIQVLMDEICRVTSYRSLQMINYHIIGECLYYDLGGVAGYILANNIVQGSSEELKRCPDEILAIYKDMNGELISEKTVRTLVRS